MHVAVPIFEFREPHRKKNIGEILYKIVEFQTYLNLLMEDLEKHEQPPCMVNILPFGEELQICLLIVMETRRIQALKHENSHLSRLDEVTR